MSSSVDTSYFDLMIEKKGALSDQSPGVYDTETGRYSIRLWDISYSIDPLKRTITPTKGSPRSSATSQFDLFIVYLLLHAGQAPLANDWVSEKDLTGGSAFFRGPHTIPTDSIVNRFGNDVTAFSKACSALSGSPLAMADAAFSFSIAPSIPVAVLYWFGDDDFPAEARLLFDSSISEILPLDIIFCLSLEVCARLCAPWPKSSS